MKNHNPARQQEANFAPVHLNPSVLHARVGLGSPLRELEAMEIDIKSVEEDVLKLLQEVAG